MLHTVNRHKKGKYGTLLGKKEWVKKGSKCRLCNVYVWLVYVVYFTLVKGCGESKGLSFLVLCIYYHVFCVADLFFWIIVYLFYLKVLSSEMDLVEIRLIR